MPTNTYVALRTQTVAVATGAVTLDLTGISGYTDLVLVINGTIASPGNYTLRFNSDTGSNYSDTVLFGDGSTAGSNRRSSQTVGYIGNGSTVIGTTIAHIMNYSNATTFKTILSRSNVTDQRAESRIVLWRNTAAITSVTVFADGQNMSIGTTISLYGIKAVQVYTPSTIPSSLNVGDQILVPYTGSATTLSIPAGVNTMRIELAGACGGGETQPIGSYGGYVAGDYFIGGSALTMYAYVGGRGAQRADTNRAGGFNGGGSASLSPSGGAEYTSGSGGGATDIRVGGTALANRIFVAGGGGGGGENTYQNGGFGGYTEGNPGVGTSTPNPFSGARGLGGTQSAGGAGGAGATDGSPAGQAGSLGQGGNGAQGAYGASGGGGGGYYGGGGGGGANNGGAVGGGGGSSFLGSLTNTTFINGSNNNHGFALLTKVS
jgi:hypothetical protein